MVALAPKRHTTLRRPFQVPPWSCCRVKANTRPGHDKNLLSALKPGLGFDYLDEAAEAKTLNSNPLPMWVAFPFRHLTSNTAAFGLSTALLRQAKASRETPKATVSPEVVDMGMRHKESVRWSQTI